MGSSVALSLVANEGPVERACVRRHVLLRAELRTTGGSLTVRLRDISVAGALVEGASLPRPGTDVLLVRGALEALATIVWTRDNRAGLIFEDPLSEEEVWSQVSPPPAAFTPPPPVYRPGFRGDQVLAEQRAVERLSHSPIQYFPAFGAKLS